MKQPLFLSPRLYLAAAIGLCVAASAVPNALPALQESDRDVIVILRDQLASVPPARRAMGTRAAAVADSQRSMVGRLQAAKSRKVTTFSTINAFATKVSAEEAAQLAAHPQVQAVVSDKIIYLPKRHEPRGAAGASGATGSAAAASTTAASTTAASSALCGTLEPEALQLTQTAFGNSSTAQAQLVLDGNGQPVTGQGVKVAFIADGLDPTVPGFIRPDGTNVFIDYQDFSGDPAGTPTAGGEAFGDASSIAAQDNPNGKLLTYDISQFVNAAHPLPSPCKIRVRGMAPGVSLVGLKVFSQLGYTTTSDFVQAIEYAVVHDDVDVINESFGGNVNPDTANDPTSLANAAAVAAGVTVTVSTGDAGSAGTLGSPSTDPYVIAVGASTQFREYAQAMEGAQPLAKGFLSGNISSLSSGGFSELSARTVDVVAPGDLGWALCSTNPSLYVDCVSYASTATPVQVFGGTSQSSPLTAGEAALVIQAYRSTHGGASPSPATVKRIIMSTATDLGAPSSEQGAGLINSLGAVKLALSIHDSHGSPASRGEEFVVDSNSVNITDAPNTHEVHTFKITNTGTTTRHLSAALQTLGAPIAGATTTVELNPASDPFFVDAVGSARSYVTSKFTVPAGAAYLNAAIAWQTNTGALTRIALLDPSGRQVAYSLPQGAGNGYGRVDVVNPAAGSWTAVIFTRDLTTTGYTGPVQFTWAAQNYAKLGAVNPASFDLAPGATQSVTANFFMPATPGDLAAGIRFTESASDGSYTLPEIPVTLRTLVALGPTGGAFSGTLTGGNGRAGAGPTQTFEFDVPAGVSNLSLALQTADSGYLLEGVLVDPNGMELSLAPNLDPVGNSQFGLQLYHYNPQPGRWTFIFVQNFFSSGNQTSLPYTARIGFNTALITASGLPNSPKTMLSASGGPVTATVNIVNTGTVTEAYFADARLTQLGSYTLPQQAGCAAAATLPGTCEFFQVPTQTSNIQFVAQSTVPIQMDAFNIVGVLDAVTGSPDIFARNISANVAKAVLSEPEVPYGRWEVAPSLVGPYGPAGAPAETVTATAVALTRQWDAAVSADSGDIWADYALGTTTFAPLVLASGQPGQITLTITPAASQVGKTVRGHVYIDTFNTVVGTGDEVVAIPYSYTVAP